MDMSENIESCIAIIGMAGRFPGAANITDFWNNLKNGIESISFLNKQEVELAYFDSSSPDHSDYVKARGILGNIADFDAGFFNINPREAEIMDPQHRLFLECAWEALENSGYAPSKFSGQIGVIASSYHNTYLLNNLYSNPELLGLLGGDVIMHGNAHDHLATHVSYKLNLKGPSFTVQTACSSSLVAIHLACQSLLGGEADIILSGGVAIHVPEKSGYLFQEGGILSPDGHCRAFDDKAAGTVFGNGLGIVVLKRLNEALADGDPIHAVIRGSAINNDGAQKVGYMAPSVEGQADVIAQALAISGVAADSIAYIESHGTGTAMGDTIEMAALISAYGNTELKNFCAIGSVKTNIGHLNAAAGVVGLIKTTLALEHKVLPPSLNFQTPNSAIDFANSPFYVNTHCQEWKKNKISRRAGISSFGVGGTNAHLILEEATSSVPQAGKSQELLIFSAKSTAALTALRQNFLKYLLQYPSTNLSDIAFTLQQGREEFSHRLMLVCDNVATAINTLQNADNKNLLTHTLSEETVPDIVFMFSGQGAQYVNMTLGLYQELPVFTQEIDRCASLLQPILGLDLKELLYPSSEQLVYATQQLQQTVYAQPALFVVEYALAKLWLSLGIQAKIMIGHSIGEYVAAHFAGVLSLENALQLVAARGKLMQQTQSGSMLAVAGSVDAIKIYLNEKLSIAAINTMDSCVISGAASEIEKLQQHLTNSNIQNQLLHTSHAFHSIMMEEILADFKSIVEKTELNAPEIPYISNLTGKTIKAEEATNPNYWVNHLRHTVLFAAGVEHIHSQYSDDKKLLFLEMGPGRSLNSFVQQAIANKPHSTYSSVRHPKEIQDDLSYFFTTLGKLWLQGCAINWSALYAEESRARISLPSYPFQRQSYWIEPNRKNNRHVAAGKNPNMLEWLYLPSWKQLALPCNADVNSSSQQWLLWVYDSPVSKQLTEYLRNQNQHIITVEPSEDFYASKNEYRLNPNIPQHYDNLIEHLAQEARLPTKMLHLWNTNELVKREFNEEFVTIQQNSAFNSLIFLVQALNKIENSLVQKIKLAIISNNMQEILGGDLLCPEKATLLGPCRVIGQEYANIDCISIDLDLSASTLVSDSILKQIFIECCVESSEKISAYRGLHRWVQVFEHWPVKHTTLTHSGLRQKGSYLITGGLGGIGITLAEYLAANVQANLILTSRSKFPVRDDWNNWLQQHGEQDPISMKIIKIKNMEKNGAQVLVLQADVTRLSDMEHVMQAIKSQGLTLHGVIHTAGLAGGGIIQAKTPAMAAEVLQPKLQGTVILSQVLKNTKLDFFLLCSSINSILNAVGQVDYCAANAFLDAFAHYLNAVAGIPALSINWDTWQDLGMAVNTAVPATMQKLRDDSLKQGIHSTEALQLLPYLLASNQPQVIVSTQELTAVIKQHLALNIQNLQSEAKYLGGESSHTRPNLSVAYVAASSEIELRIVAIWEELLGIKGIGVEDNFFDLGGHSLLGSQVLARLRELFSVELSLDTIFNLPTVADLAIAVEDHILAELEA